MHSTTLGTATLSEPPYAIEAPTRPTTPLVFASPHSGTDYPAAFIAESRLDPVTLRRSEDSFIDEIFAAAPACGAPLLKALFPRAYCDPNREPYELDQGMFEDALPRHANTASLRVVGGLGTIARVVANGADIYRRKLRFAEAEERIETLYRPYHEALRGLLDDALARCGCAILIDCHSMPSVGGPMDRDEGRPRPDMVLGDRNGASCDPSVVDAVERALQGMGYRTTRNDPYAGGFTTQHYGRPKSSVHALQIEINRALYMDEDRIRLLPEAAALTANVTRLISILAKTDFSPLRRPA